MGSYRCLVRIYLRGCRVVVTSLYKAVSGRNGCEFGRASWQDERAEYRQKWSGPCLKGEHHEFRESLYYNTLMINNEEVGTLPYDIIS